MKWRDEAIKAMWHAAEDTPAEVRCSAYEFTVSVEAALDGLLGWLREQNGYKMFGYERMSPYAIPKALVELLSEEDE